MLYNLEKKNVRNPIDCLSCKYFDKKLKKCEGLNKNCFLYDEKTKTVIDGVTNLPLKINN